MCRVMNETFTFVGLDCFHARCLHSSLGSSALCGRLNGTCVPLCAPPLQAAPARW